MNRFARVQPALLGLLLVACATADPAEPAVTPEPSSAAPTGSASAAGSGSPPASASAPSTEPEPSAPADPLLAVVVTDVRSGEELTIGELAAEETLLLEPMAVWCTSCRAQQHEVVAAHQEADFESLSLDVDLSESPEDLAAYADREGFDWHFAMADAELYRLLQERFGVAVTNPPSTPIIVIERDGTVRPLEFGRGVRSAEELLDEIGLS